MAFTDLLGAADQLALDILGDSVTYTPGVGDAVEVQGIFDAAYVRVDPGQAGISTCSPAVFLRLEDLGDLDPTSDTAAAVTVDGTDYTIFEVKPDGLGGVVLILNAT